jgi:putative phosphoribosyl transferase
LLTRVSVKELIFGKRSSSSTSSSSSSSKFSGFLSSLKDGSALQLQLKDRVSAGKVLATVLKTGVVKRKRDGNDLLVLGIPRGGVIVADVIAEKLNADYFDIVIPRKLRAPENKENAIGAISQDGSTLYLDEFMVSSLKIPAEYIEKEKAEQLQEIKRRIALYKKRLSESLSVSSNEKKEEYPITPDKTTVLLIDDGIATGATVIAAARWLKANYKLAQLIIAAPVASKQAVELIKKEEKDVADIVETVTTPANFVSVSQFYKDFEQATDDKVIEILSKWQRRRMKSE